ncbi:MAG: DUF3188 domain-containing protein [Synechococcaceae cyanobacterium]
MSPLSELPTAAETGAALGLASRQRAMLLALSGPLLILLPLLMLLLQGRRGLQGLPALLIGVGLMGHSWLSRRRRRRQLLRALRQEPRLTGGSPGPS